MEYLDKQAEYGVRAYIECLGDIKKELKMKGMDLALHFIGKIKSHLSLRALPESHKLQFLSIVLPSLSKLLF